MIWRDIKTKSLAVSAESLRGEPVNPISMKWLSAPLAAWPPGDTSSDAALTVPFKNQHPHQSGIGKANHLLEKPAVDDGESEVF